MRKHILSALSVVMLCAGCGTINSDGTASINLAGQWQFTTDSTQWNSTITLPGSMTSNGLGDPIGLQTPWTGEIVDNSFFNDDKYAPYRRPDNFKVPFWLQPTTYYKGPAWYSKVVNIPDDWKDRDISLFLERAHWQTQLWVDGKDAGSRNSLGAPHQYDLSQLLTPGTHTITLRIDNSINRIDPGINSHSLSDHTQGNWNGIVGDIRLVTRPKVNIKHIDIYPHIPSGSIRVKSTLVNRNSTDSRVELTLSADGSTAKTSFILPAGTTTSESTLNLSDSIKLWDEFNPNLYTLQARIKDLDQSTVHSVSQQFGMREFKVLDNKITINGRPTFLRGTLDCAAFPLTGYPPTDIQEWLRIFSAIKSHGLNHVRYHSWCPPEAAFEAADQLGLYLEIECSSWANTTSAIGNGKPIDDYIMQESEAIVSAYGNHPSFCMMMYGNEPAGANQAEYLTDFIEKWKNTDNRRIYSSAGGWPNLPVSDFLSDINPRIQGWGQGLGSIINAQPPRTDYDWTSYTGKWQQPVVSHEVGQWCAYPNFNEISKYTGVMHPANFEIFRETLRENGMQQLADSFLLASGKLQTLCYKADIEAALRTKDFGGFQLLGLSDFPGQGTALVGTLDAFWQEKGYVSPDEYRRFCNSTVPLARMPRLVYTSADTLNATVEVAHFGIAPLHNVSAQWRLNDDSGNTVASGNWENLDIQIGNCDTIGQITLPLNIITQPSGLNLAVNVDGFENDWNIWVYPQPKANNPSGDTVLMTSTLNADAIRTLDNGGTVLLSLRHGSLAPDFGGDIQIGFSSIFWNTAWTRRQPPHTLGILCNPEHPALHLFPTDYHSDYQWWDAMSHSEAIEYAKLNPDLKPIVRVIDDWFTNRPLALIFEAKTGRGGKILISGVDLWSDMAVRPEARQLLASIKNYMSSPAFDPSVEVSTQSLARLIK